MKKIIKRILIVTGSLVIILIVATMVLPHIFFWFYEDNQPSASDYRTADKALENATIEQMTDSFSKMLEVEGKKKFYKNFAENYAAKLPMKIDKNTTINAVAYFHEGDTLLFYSRLIETFLKGNKNI